MKPTLHLQSEMSVELSPAVSELPGHLRHAFDVSLLMSGLKVPFGHANLKAPEQ